MQEQIESTIKKALPDAIVHVESPDGTHYGAVVISPAFEELSLVQQHQLVLNALRTEFDSERLHALQLKTFTPDKWETMQKQGPLSVV